MDFFGFSTKRENKSERDMLAEKLKKRYPDNKRNVNVMLAVQESGIADEINGLDVLSEDKLDEFASRLERDYGIMPKYSKICLGVCADSMGISMTQKKASIYDAEILKAVDASQNKPESAEGSLSEYEIEENDECVTIKKYKGFDKKEIIVPNRFGGLPVVCIDEDAFAKCVGIEKVVVPEGIKTIRNGAFSGCTSLKEVILPSGLRYIGNRPKKNPFYSSMKNYIAINYKVKGNWYYKGVFEGSALEYVKLPDSVEYIGNRSFALCRSLRYITLPAALKTIGEGSFMGCKSLHGITLPKKLSLIKQEMFYDSGIKKIEIPASVKEIESNAFKCCWDLEGIGLHEGLKKLGSGVFSCTDKLASVTIPKSVISIGEYLLGENTVCYCYEGSYGLVYARENGYTIRNAEVL